jgi:RNA polymerase sigma-70 factor (TIGR02957 family)
VITEAPTLQTYQSLRPYLFAVAYRMTGSASDAEDLVQDAWIRYLDAGRPRVESLRAWLTTVISRLALDYLKSARVKREQYIGTWMPEPVLTSEALPGPEESAEQREDVSLALLTLMETLTPEQRVVYVLREGFDLPYDEIATHVHKTPAACRQVFRRARQRLDEPGHVTPARPEAHEALITRFMEAVSTGDASGIAAILAEDAIWLADSGPERLANRHGVIGRDRIARGFAGLMRKIPQEMVLSVNVVDLNGQPAVVVFDRGRLERVFAFDTTDSGITAIRILINPEKLRHLAAALGTEPAWETPIRKPRSAVAR